MPLSPKLSTKAHRSKLCVDDNVLVYAHRKDLPEHQTYRPLLERSPMMKSHWGFRISC
jgi:hypothetical protein